MNYWKVQRGWEGQTAVIMGSGPSITYEISNRIRQFDVRSIAVNNQGIDVGDVPAMAPWADILYAADKTWWHKNRKSALAFKGRKVTISSASHPFGFEDESVYVMRNGGSTGFDVRK